MCIGDVSSEYSVTIHAIWYYSVGDQHSESSLKEFSALCFLFSTILHIIVISFGAFTENRKFCNCSELQKSESEN